jgi:hypothetical protein
MPIPVIAAEPWNPSGVSVRKGTAYRFEVLPPASWKDSHVTCGPNGFVNMLDPFGWFLRVRRAGGQKARYFTLIGTIGKSLDHAFVIGAGCVHTATADGECFLFANDWSSAYGNNHGTIDINISEV